jgi:hypothetical protein
MSYCGGGFRSNSGGGERDWLGEEVEEIEEREWSRNGVGKEGRGGLYL